MLSRPGCHLCEEMRRQVEEILAGTETSWEVIDVDSDEALASRFGESIPLLYVNGKLFAKTRLPRMAVALRLRRAAGRGA